MLALSLIQRHQLGDLHYITQPPCAWISSSGKTRGGKSRAYVGRLGEKIRHSCNAATEKEPCRLSGDVITR